MNILMIISVSFVLLFSVIIVIVSKYWLRGRFAAIWSALLWFPYCVLFVYICTRLFPITNQGDVPPPGTGFIVMGGLILYPFYIMILSMLSIAFFKTKKSIGQNTVA
ncbi:hypothetical protein GI584_14785 [Gracilibacillus salitolerans]|uniref:Uncharacterized protein n=1 Tax=Gracilibacillus salitolerans TaxID=2663022 RepID=A0A5Q2TKF9_9BACI|nr:hypothetical protein [Gracilibacillus salitolerans]QGH35236.1 hypothetical protein GI584_14785 [Gracilibacillus salitolerans]